MALPLVSFIVPAFNAERYVGRCIDSILAQTYSQYEVIVVDDGSTDNTPTILDDYAIRDSRVKVIHKYNGGVSSARNMGLQQAKGEWISFIDIDDFVSPDFLRVEDFYTIADLIVKSWVYTDGCHSNETLSSLSVKQSDLSFYLSDHLHLTVFRTPWAKLFRRSIIEEHSLLFNPCYRLGEDNLFVLDYLKYVFRIFVSNYGTYLYERPVPAKYRLAYVEAKSYLTEFWRAYSILKISSPQLVYNKLIWYSSFVADFTLTQKLDWYTDKVISALYNHCNYFFGRKEKFRNFMCRFLSKFR